MGLREASPFVWHLLVSTGVLAFAGLCLALAIRRWSRTERVLATAALGAQTVASFVLLWVIMDVYGVGDVVTFFRQGELLVRYIDLRGANALADVVGLVFQRDVQFPFIIVGIGTPTGSMAGIGGLVLLVTRSIWAGNLVMALLSFSGRMAIYGALRGQFDPALRTRLMLAILFVPSVTFWSSGLVKEAVTLWGLGWLVLGLHTMARGRWLAGTCLAISGAIPVGISKPYIFLPLVIASGVAVYWRTRVADDALPRPWRLGLAVVAATAGVVVVGRLFPAYSVDNLGDQVALHQLYGMQAGGGSYYEVGEDDGQTRSLVGQLAYAPLGLITAWYRPFFFEVVNPMMLVNSVESTGVLILSLLTVAGGRLKMSWAVIRRSPALMFCSTFATMTGVGLGVTSTNLGSLSRYRIVMMPFLIVVLIVVHKLARARSEGRARPPEAHRAVESATLRNRSSHLPTRRPRS